MLWRQLQAVGLLDADKFSYGRLFGKLQQALKSPKVPAEFREIAQSVVRAAKATHNTRNEYAHTLFMHYPEFEEGLVRSGRPGVQDRTLAAIGGGIEEARAVTWRMRGVWIIAPHWIGGKTDPYETASDLRSWTRVAMGHIADDPRMVVGTLGPSPEPHGGYKDGPVGANRG